MAQYRIRRFAESKDGTFGHFEIADESVFDTLEEEGLDNQRNISRIPAGTYLCKRTIYHKHGFGTFEITGVPDRDRILFHPGNTEEDTQGCVLVGQGFGLLSVMDEDTGEWVDKMAVYHSQRSFREFMALFADVDEFELEITDPEWT